MLFDERTIKIKTRYELSDKEYDQLADDIDGVVDSVVIKRLIENALEGLTNHQLIVEVK